MSNACNVLHRTLNSYKTYSFPFQKESLPENGIYILFEKGEVGHGLNRIVRIGTHTGQNQLRSRLYQHFLSENKDRSIFRKNIGRALLNKNNNEYLSIWEIDFTTKDSKIKFGDLLDKNKQNKIEKMITKYLHQNFSFCILEINEKNKRLELESKLISTISNCKECGPSPTWLGLFSPKEKIRTSGLWLVNELWKTPLSDEEVKNLSELNINH